MHYDVFNGDADGIIALVQLRLAEPKESMLVTGVKRDIKLLGKFASSDDVTSVTALDISMEKNREALITLLNNGVSVFYCDHHRSGDIPQSDELEALIDLDAETCTSLLINQKLGGKFAKWAVAAAFGDNLHSSAKKLASELGLSPEDTHFLEELGTLINYNGYGGSLADLHIAPAELYRKLLAFPCPLMLREDPSSPFYVLKAGYAEDYFHISHLKPTADSEVSAVYELPNEAWARRISGVFGNDLANAQPNKAHAVITLNQSGADYTVSVRAPLNNRIGADEICSAFPTGGGRKAAAGINQLPLADKEKFIQTLTSFYA
ncbi:acetyltransferase [Vibrio panuliri]|uniref:Acetyltransferase n=1 Tax=Vibrio panuliri TaxID=1381081 RepID=A0A1Q9HCZ9_9VIBR|nr:acetyltransferase [Vibrio panuliri]OLQ87325.1 acetyltransferase [Vibrio panuliri]